MRARIIGLRRLAETPERHDIGLYSNDVEARSAGTMKSVALEGALVRCRLPEFSAYVGQAGIEVCFSRSGSRTDRTAALPDL